MRDSIADAPPRSAYTQSKDVTGKKITRVDRANTYALRIMLLAAILLPAVVVGGLLMQSIASMQASGKVGKTMFTYNGSAANGIYAVAWSPTGDRVASASSNVQIWDAMTGAHPLTLNTKGAAVSTVAWSPDGKYLATASSAIALWDAQSGDQTFTYTTQAQKSGAPGTLHVQALAWSPDRSMIATAYTYAVEGKNAATRLSSWVDVWNAKTGATIFTYRGHKSIVRSIAWSSDSKRIASAGADGLLAVWDATNGANVVKYATTGKVNSVAWSPNNKFLVSASNHLDIWNVKNPTKPLGTLSTNASKTVQVSWSPDGSLIATADTSVHLWNAGSGNEVYNYTEHQNPLSSLSWSSDGKYLASSDTAAANNTNSPGVVKVWQAA